MVAPRPSSASTTPAPSAPVPPVTTTCIVRRVAVSENDRTAGLLELVERVLETGRQVAVADRVEHGLVVAVAVRLVDELLEANAVGGLAEARRAVAVTGDHASGPARAVALERVEHHDLVGRVPVRRRRA